MRRIGKEGMGIDLTKIHYMRVSNYQAIKKNRMIASCVGYLLSLHYMLNI